MGRSPISGMFVQVDSLGDQGHKNFPNALIVVYRFYVIRLVNQHFLKLWQDYDSEGQEPRVTESDAPSSLEAVGRAEGEAA